MIRTSFFLSLLLVCLCFFLEASDRLISYSNQPLGSKEEPLVFRTYVPDLNLDKEVLTHHHRGYESPRYSVKEAKDHPTQTYKLLMGLPAAIAVNEGKAFSYVWDTLECRLIYAWNDGFLDMQNYWGNQFLGNRRGFGYTSVLYGKLFYKAQGAHPLSLNAKPLSAYEGLMYRGHRMEKNRPVFMLEAEGNLIEVSVSEGEKKYSLQLTYELIEGEGKLKYQKSENVDVKIVSPQSLVVKYEGKMIQDYPLQEEKGKDEVSMRKGKKLYANMGCNACHTLDGTKSHGPSFKELVMGEKRELVDGKYVFTDEEYLKTSITDPNKQLVKGYPPNFMPAFGTILKKPEVDSLVLFLQSINKVKD